jgi:hypothetical protein
MSPRPLIYTHPNPPESSLFQLGAHETQYSQREPALNLPLLKLVAKEEELEVGAANCAAWFCTREMRP